MATKMITHGCWLMIECRDGSKIWVPLKDINNSIPIKVM